MLQNQRCLGSYTEPYKHCYASYGTKRESIDDQKIPIIIIHCDHIWNHVVESCPPFDNRY